MGTMFRLNNDSIQPAAGTKLIKSSELGQLLEASALLDAAREKAAEMERAALEAYEEKKQEGYQDGLEDAQVSGRNNITWEEKFEFDLCYINSGITLWGDIKIILKTVGKVFKREDTVREGTSSDVDFGDWLLTKGDVTQEEYDSKQAEAKELLGV